LNDLLGCQLLALLFRQGVCSCLISQEEAATPNSGHSRTGCRLEKIPAAQTIAVERMS
jgi:hypothetical protein